MIPHLIPIIEPMDPRRGNVYEHTPLDYYKHGEYPRFIRPVDAHRLRVAEVDLERAVMADDDRPCLFHVAGPCFHPRCLEAHLVTLRQKETRRSGLRGSNTPEEKQPPETRGSVYDI